MISKVFPSFLRAKLERHEGLKGIAQNAGWLVLDKGIRMITSVIVGAWVARYLGPSNFGTWSYASAFVLIFNAISTLGADGIIVRNIINDRPRTAATLGSAWFLRVLSGIASWILALAGILLLKNDDPEIILLVAVLSLSFIINSADVIDFFFQSILGSKHIIKARIIALVFASGLRIIAIVFSWPLIAFAIIQIIELLIAACLFVVYFHSSGQHIKRWRIEKSTMKDITVSSFGMLIDSFLVVVSMQIDRIFLEHYHTKHEVGIYATAVNLSQLWYFIPVFIGASIVPLLVESYRDNKEKYERVLKNVFGIMTVCSIVLAVVTTFASGFIIDLLYGPKYHEAAAILSLHIWTCVFVFHVSIRSRSLVIENKAKYVGIFSITMSIFNVVLNLLLLPKYGAMGAVVSALISWVLCAMILPLSSDKTRKYVYHFVRSFVPSFHA